jgi:hypothetical protein
MIMQCSKALLIFCLLFSGVIIAEEPDKRLVSELTIAELKETVRDIVEDSIEKCVVKGTMEGRAKVNLRVEGEVIAQMECNFEDNESTDNE